MVYPIAIGLAATAAALLTKALVKTVRRYEKLSPQMIASLNKIRMENTRLGGASKVDSNDLHIRYLKSRFNNEGFEPKMTEREALLILGIEAEDIGTLDKLLLRKRYRTLMVANHPDHSGGVLLSQKINQAKEILENSYLFRK